MVELLLAHGANVGASTCGGWLAIHNASHMGSKLNESDVEGILEFNQVCQTLAQKMRENGVMLNIPGGKRRAQAKHGDSCASVGQCGDSEW